MKESTRNRVIFSFLYNKTTSHTVKHLARGLNSGEVADKVGTNTMSVAAVKANLTRGTYYPFAYVENGKVKGICSY